MATLVEFVFSRSTSRFCRVVISADISAMSWLEAMVRVATMRQTANAQTRGGSTWEVAKVTKRVACSSIPYEQADNDWGSRVFGHWFWGRPGTGVSTGSYDPGLRDHL
jgi:hypothetical protein